MQRCHRSPYTIHSSAIKICHAVSIDERRAKFRQVLVSEKEERRKETHLNHFRRASRAFLHLAPNEKTLAPVEEERYSKRFRSRSRDRSRSPGRRPSYMSGRSEFSASIDPSFDSRTEDENIVQVVTELWFPGCHADIGGGWNPEAPDNLSLSHAPLVWMVREAQKAGLVFDPEKMQERGCYYVDDLHLKRPSKARGRTSRNEHLSVPVIEVNDAILPVSPILEDVTGDDSDGVFEGASLKCTSIRKSAGNEKFVDYLHSSSTRGQIHDSLQRKHGTPTLTVLQWNFMEFLPFRRMVRYPRSVHLLSH
jgi:hypothetical protein